MRPVPKVPKRKVDLNDSWFNSRIWSTGAHLHKEKLVQWQPRVHNGLGRHATKPKPDGIIAQPPKWSDKVTRGPKTRRVQMA